MVDTINTYADFATTTPGYNGQRFSLTEYNSGTNKGGGEFIAVSGSVTPDNGITFSGPSGWYFKRLGVENINVQHFGALGTNVNDDVAIERAITKFLSLGSGSFGGQYPNEGQLPLYFPAGHYKVSTFTEIIFTGTGQEVFGDGVSSRLDGIGIDITQNRCRVRDLLLTGSGSYGIKNDGTSNNVRDGIISCVTIRDRDYNLRLIGNQANLVMSQVFSEKAIFDGFRGDECINFTAVGCHFQRNTRDGVRITKGGEYKFNGCTMSSNNDLGLHILAADSTNQVLESYFTDCTITVNQLDVENRDTYTISAIGNNGSGGTTITIGAHKLIEDLLLVNIFGTTDYNGSHTIFNVTNTSFDIAVAFTSNQTGSVRRPEWDAYIVANTSLGHANDFWFTGGNINYLHLQRVYNANFENTRIKQQAHLESGCNRIFFIGNARGRRGSTYKDINISGQNTGWSRIMYSDNSGGTSAGNGSCIVRTPDNTTALVGNLPQRFNEVVINESGITANAMGRSFTLNAKGLLADAYCSIVTPLIIENTAYSFTPPFPAGKCIFTNGSGQNAREVTFTYSATVPSNIATGFQGTVMNLTTGILTGTSGVNGKISISIHTDGKLYIETYGAGNQTGYFTFFR